VVIDEVEGVYRRMLPLPASAMRTSPDVTCRGAAEREEPKGRTSKAKPIAFRAFTVLLSV
jgi:hypothetical protein